MKGPRRFLEGQASQLERHLLVAARWEQPRAAAVERALLSVDRRGTGGKGRVHTDERRPRARSAEVQIFPMSEHPGLTAALLGAARPGIESSDSCTGERAQSLRIVPAPRGSSDAGGKTDGDRRILFSVALRWVIIGSLLGLLVASGIEAYRIVFHHWRAPNAGRRSDCIELRSTPLSSTTTASAQAEARDPLSPQPEPPA